MKNKKKGQLSVEYLIIIGFVTFAISITIALGMVYSGLAKDSISINQAEVFANKIIDSAESVFYAGSPTQTVLTAYLPSQVINITVLQKEIVISISTSTGINIQSFPSKVQLEGNISSTEGLKKIKLRATSDRVIIS